MSVAAQQTYTKQAERLMNTTLTANYAPTFYTRVLASQFGDEVLFLRNEQDSFQRFNTGLHLRFGRRHSGEYVVSIRWQRVGDNLLSLGAIYRTLTFQEAFATFDQLISWAKGERDDPPEDFINSPHIAHVVRKHAFECLPTLEAIRTFFRRSLFKVV